jgi:hypothetical protein
MEKMFKLLIKVLINCDNQNAFNTLATFLSVTIAFTITAFSAFATSKFSKELYLQEDINNNSKTLLNNLVDLFKRAMWVFTLTIILILIYQSFDCKTFKGILCYIKLIIWILAILSFYFFIKLFNKFTQFVTQTAKRQ